MKKCLLRLAVALVLVTVSAPPIAKAEAPDPTCGPNGCQKPGIRQFLAVDPTCDPNGCQKPGVRMQIRWRS